MYYNTSIWHNPCSTRKLYNSDKMSTSNADENITFHLKMTCYSRLEDLRIINLNKIAEMKEKRMRHKLWKI